MEKTTMTALETAEYLGVNRATIYRWSLYAGLPSKQVNGRVRLYNKEKVDEWVKGEDNELKEGGNEA
ncbi:excisionase family DNA-binding protein [Listeria booriae]|uniref:excisionase family DNA-binding protein n=1 Tax=Listeria booriae TaxID=1552123 RepID=UPI00164CEC81|nr:excisionase family DNA-binding protein [Listeria booriae]MBC6134281.1 excisionase family DNA-binding protein [Listeria booriae]